MELKDLTLSIEDAKDIRGGRLLRSGNSISQTSANGGVYGQVAVGGQGFNLSPVSIVSEAGQFNTTEQGAAIHDVRETVVDVDILGSQLQLGGWGRGFVVAAGSSELHGVVDGVLREIGRNRAERHFQVLRLFRQRDA